MQEVTAGGRRELVLLFHFLVFVGETSGQTQMLRKRRRCFGTARRLAKGWRPASVCQLVTWWQINNRNSLFCFVYFLRQYRNWDVRPGRSLPRKEHAWILGPENSGHCRRHSTQTSPARTEREKHPAQRQSSLHRQHVRVAPLLLLARTHLSLIIQIFDFISLFFLPRVWTHHDQSFLYMLFDYVCGGELFSYLRNAGRFSSSTGNVSTIRVGKVTTTTKNEGKFTTTVMNRNARYPDPMETCIYRPSWINKWKKRPQPARDWSRLSVPLRFFFPFLVLVCIELRFVCTCSAGSIRSNPIDKSPGWPFQYSGRALVMMCRRVATISTRSSLSLSLVVLLFAR